MKGEIYQCPVPLLSDEHYILLAEDSGFRGISDLQAEEGRVVEEWSLEKEVRKARGLNSKCSWPIILIPQSLTSAKTRGDKWLWLTLIPFALDFLMCISSHLSLILDLFLIMSSLYLIMSTVSLLLAMFLQFTPNTSHLPISPFACHHDLGACFDLRQGWLW